MENSNTPQQNLDPEKIVTFRRTHLYAALLPLAFVVGLAVGFLLWGRPQETAAAAPQAAAPQAAAPQAAAAQAEATPQQIKRYDVPVDDDPSQGPADAQITLIEFSDYQCPYCSKWHNEVWPKLKEAFPGQIRFVYRDFPLMGLHESAAPAAQAANCAGEQDQYWAYHDKLFSGDYDFSSDGFKKIAGDISLDTAKFDECVSTERFKAEVEADYQYAAELGIRSTPTFFVNGIPLVGAQPYEVFKELIDKELAGEIP